MSRVAVAIYPGSFDPFTRGHMDILRRALAIFDHVHVVIAKNPDKEHTMFSEQQRISIIKVALNELELHHIDAERVTVLYWSQLIGKYAEQHNIKHIIRGIRGSDDMEKETRLAKFNNMAFRLETIYFHSPDEYSNISSSLVRMLIGNQFIDQAINIMPNGCPAAWLKPLFERKRVYVK
jgi:pantetheine-phosphate adenylyltransferase